MHYKESAEAKKLLKKEKALSNAAVLFYTQSSHLLFPF